MQTSLNTVVKNIFNVNNLQELSEQQLEDFINSSPYASIGHLLLAKKKKLALSDYNKEASKAAIYINNPLWLHGFLQEETIDSLTNEGSHQMVPSEDIVSMPPETVSSTATMESTDFNNEVKYEDVAIQKGGHQQELVIENNNPVHTSETGTEEVIGTDSKNVEVLSQESTENFIADETVQVNVPLEEISPETAPGEATLRIFTDSPIANEVIELNKEKPIEKMAVASESISGNELVFQSYHTVDYFASQGIKLRAGELGNDKLGKQLKSFTEWLRTMKKVAAIPVNEVANDDSIIRIAEESIETSDVETEAMAEVWIKQGKTGRAVAIYRKLSLLNPAKSHYFASKIEQLNA